MPLYDLKNESIDIISDELVANLRSNKIDMQTITRVRIAAEEILLNYQTNLGTDTEVSLSVSKRLGSINVILSAVGEKDDPFDDISEEDMLLHNVMESMGYMPTWEYQKGKNIINFSLKRPPLLPSWAYVVLSAALGVCFGLVARTLPVAAKSVLTDKVLSPLSSAIMGFLSTVSVLMVFLSIISGICGMGDITTFNKIGKRMLGRFLIGLGIVTVGTTVALPFLFSIGGVGGSGFDFASLWQMVLDIIPSNIIDAFQKGNTLQVIFLAAMIGIVALSLIRKMHELTEWTQQLSVLVQALIEIIIKVLPVVVFISIFNLFATNGFKDLVSLYKLPLYVLLLCLAWAAFIVARTCITQKVNVFVLIKKLIPTFLIALSTASSSAAFSANMETCEKKFGIDKQIINVGVPLSQSLYKPSSIIQNILGVMCMAEVFQIEMTWSVVITLIITSFILALAAPPMPGSSISVFALLFAQCGIPAGAISLVIALDPILDRLITPIIVLSDQLELVQLASATGKLDTDILRKKM